MGKKRMAEERRRYAEEKGFDDDDTGVGNNPIPRDISGYFGSPAAMVKEPPRLTSCPGLVLAIQVVHKRVDLLHITVSSCAPPQHPLFARSFDSALDINSKAMCWVVTLTLRHAFVGMSSAVLLKKSLQEH